MGIAVSCHTESYTSTSVQELVSQSPVRFDSLAELQLFLLKFWNIDSRCTAAGFFALNLNLLRSLAELLLHHALFLFFG